MKKFKWFPPKHIEPDGDRGTTVALETEPQRLRRECIEWIQQETEPFDELPKSTAREIMEHCFGVALKLMQIKE